MTIAIELREHDALQADRDDWASSAGALLEVAASYKVALDNSTTELANMTARAEYWESAANRALGELQTLQMRFRAEYGLPVARWGDGPLVSAAAPDGQPGCVLVAPGRLSDGTCLY